MYTQSSTLSLHRKPTTRADGAYQWKTLISDEKFQADVARKALHLQGHVKVYGKPVENAPIETIRDMLADRISTEGLGPFELFYILMLHNRTTTFDKLQQLSVSAAVKMVTSLGYTALLAFQYWGISRSSQKLDMKLTMMDIFSQVYVDEHQALFRKLQEFFERYLMDFDDQITISQKQIFSVIGDSDSVMVGQDHQDQLKRDQLVESELQKQSQDDQFAAILQALQGISSEQRSSRADMRGLKESQECMVNELSKVNDRLSSVTHRVDQIQLVADDAKRVAQKAEQQVSALSDDCALEFQQQKALLHATMLHNSQLERDGKTLYFVCQKLSDCNLTQFREQLQNWLEATKLKYPGNDRLFADLQEEVQHGYMSHVQHKQVHKVALQVRDKVVRDQLCWKLKVSPDRPADVRVQAALTLHQRNMRTLLGKKISENPGWSMSMAADMAEIRSQERQGAWRISLSAPEMEIYRALNSWKEQVAKHR